MKTVLDILQAAGIGAAVGIRPFLPALLVGALAAGKLGVNFRGTDFSFLAEAPFLLAMLVGLVLFDLARRRLGDDAADAGAIGAVVGVIAGAVAAFEGAGTLDDHGKPIVAGIVAAVAAAGLAWFAIRPVFARVRVRLGAEAGLLPLYREALALAVAGLCVLLPPLAIVVVAGLVFMLAGGRRREGEKYAGLRILR